MFKQTSAVVAMNLRAVPQRLGASSVIVVGIAGVVAVLVSVLAMATGFNQTVAKAGSPDRAIVLRGGSQAEINSGMGRDSVQTVLDSPGIRKDADGKPIGTGDMVTIVNLPKISDGSDSNVTLRGTGAKFTRLRPELRIVQGRMFEPAVRELIVGEAALKQFKGVTVGSRLNFRESDWTIVGVFSTGGDNHESELIGDVDTVQSAFRRTGFSSITVLLESPDSFEAFKDHLTTDPTLTVDAKREPEYYAEQSKQITTLLNFMAYFVGGIMAIGATFGALNTMYSAVSARGIEIATLRAIGFGAMPVVISIFVEALLLSLLGGIIGAALAWVFFNGNAVSTLGSNFSQVVFQLTVSPALVISGIVLACVIGSLGGLFPAIRAARLPIATALRAT
ncbi:MAG: ABC-type antimicrobial peptide transport system [Hydrocarboniphaga sp.]|uniref:ABC transporter permease n=1 Tax=Hydrocarboniphaga sp. TaxID=2033016 RepID=UPI0026374E67|nr:ABC transporter permease [Hydrocarboniphaga sp.]MDB5969614.1 ABC-type antimicrobial peptide transport system [Hydrocarboniphaga sp.]